MAGKDSSKQCRVHNNAQIISELARAKAVFQQRTIVTILTETPAPSFPRCDETGVAGTKQAHVAEVTNDAGITGHIFGRRESMGTAVGEGVPALSPTIDTESPKGSWAAILPFCQYIKQSDF